MSEEEIEDTIKRGHWVKHTIESDGWQKVLKPALERKQNAVLKEFALAPNITYESALECQKTVQAIELVFALISTALAEMEEAEKE